MNVPLSDPSMVSGTASGETVRNRLFRLLDEIQNEGAPAQDDDRRLRRWGVQAPVLIGTNTGSDLSKVTTGGGHPGEASFPFNRSFELICHGWATDLCESGIGLLTEQPLPSGEVLHVSLQALLSEPMLIPVRIVYSRRILAQTFRAGGSFLFE